MKCRYTIKVCLFNELMVDVYIRVVSSY